MAASFLYDTGAILAILDQRDRWHHNCAETFRQLPLPGITSEAVLAELFHIVRRSRVETERVWSFVRSEGVELAAITGSELPQLHHLMRQYRDFPMDFADATLVHLAGRESVSTIITTDHKHFSAYRINARKTFRVLPLERP